MRHQRLKSVVVEGFTSIRSAELPLHDLNVLVGANGKFQNCLTVI
jgi:predicted ATPase